MLWCFLVTVASVVSCGDYVVCGAVCLAVVGGMGCTVLGGSVGGRRNDEAVPSVVSGDGQRLEFPKLTFSRGNSDDNNINFRFSGYSFSNKENETQKQNKTTQSNQRKHTVTTH